MGAQMTGRSPGAQYDILKGMLDAFTPPEGAPAVPAPTHFRIIDNAGNYLIDVNLNGLVVRNFLKSQSGEFTVVDKGNPDDPSKKGISYNVFFGGRQDDGHGLLNPHLENSRTQGSDIRSVTWSVEEYRKASEEYRKSLPDAGGHDLVMGENAYFMFHLSFDGGHSWSRAMLFTMDTNPWRRWVKKWGLDENDWQGRKPFFDDDISNLGDTYQHPNVNHIWGFAESENLWFGGSRKLSVGEQHAVWYGMRDVGGDPNVKDTVLFNHQQAEEGGGPNIFAVLYDYTIQSDDLLGDIPLLPLGESYVADVI